MTSGPKLLFADPKGRVLEHPYLIATLRSGEELVPPQDRPIPLPSAGRLVHLPGRLPVGLHPETGEPLPDGDRPLFERSDFDKVFDVPVPAAAPPATVAGAAPAAGAWGTQPAAEPAGAGVPLAPLAAGVQPPGLVLTPSHLTVLAVAAVLLLGLVFGAGVLVGKLLLGP